MDGVEPLEGCYEATCYDELPEVFLALALLAMPGESPEDQTSLHIGLTWRASSEGLVQIAQVPAPIKLFHQPWHLARLGPAPLDLWRGYVLLLLLTDPDPLVREVDLLRVSALARRVARANPHGLPYSMMPGASFDESGQVVSEVGDGVPGFTCSTFVLALLERAQIPLLDRASWPIRREDHAAFLRLIALLELHKALNTQQLAYLRAHAHTWPRLRPEEVAAAALCEPPYPVSFDEVSARAPALRERVIASCAAPP